MRAQTMRELLRQKQQRASTQRAERLEQQREIAVPAPRTKPVQLKGEGLMKELIDEVNGLRGDELTVFVCGRHTGSPQTVDREKLVILICVKKRRPAKSP